MGNRSSKVTEAFNQVVKETAHSLKSLGFTKSGQNFYLKQAGNWGLINFQKSRWNTSTVIEFKVNLGIASTTLLQFFKPVTWESRPTISACHWRKNLGSLLEPRHDHWWLLSQNSTPERIATLAEEIRVAVTDIGIPTLFKYISDESLRDLWLSKRPTFLSEFQRFKHLLVLLKKYGPANSFDKVSQEFIRHCQERMPDYSAEQYVSTLDKVDFEHLWISQST